MTAEKPVLLSLISKKLRRRPDEYRDLAGVIDRYTLGQGREILLTEGTNALPLALGYYGRKDRLVLRTNWLRDKMRKQSLPDILGGADVWLLASGDSQVKPYLEQLGYRPINRPTRFGHIDLYGYAAPRPKQP